MNRFIRPLASVSLLACAASALAVPAKPGPVPFTMPDGSVLNVRILGDEFHHYYTSEDGYYLVEENGEFYYADIDASGKTVRSNIRAVDADQRSAQAVKYLQGVNMDHVRAVMSQRAEARDSRMGQTVRIAPPAFASDNADNSGIQKGPGLFPGSHFPNRGEQKGLVILVEYTDVKFRTQKPQEFFDRMLNEPGFSDPVYGGTGSAADFFTENSNGVFLPEFDVYGPVTLSHSMSYYGGNDASGNDKHPEQMVVEACKILDDEIDFTEYDRDGDGVVDNVFIFYAGRGEASGGGANTVWPHAWNVEYGHGSRPVHDGVMISRYACSNEWEGSRPDGIGTFCHEFSHVMGLPDLYATSYTSSFTPGAWSAMDYGPYNNEGRTPPYYSAFERYALGWIEPMVMNAPANCELLPINVSNAAGIVSVSSKEFFLFENRQKQGWDAFVPGHGMLVWHVDYNESVWNSNKVNNTPGHQYVDIEEADGTQSESTRSGDAFPGTKHVTSFTDSGNPNMKSWSGRDMNTPVTEITETDGKITFMVKGGAENNFPTPVALEASDIYDDMFTAHWVAEPDTEYAISVYRKSESGDPIYICNSRNVGFTDSYTVTGLTQETQYYYTVMTTNGWAFSDPSNEIAVTTILPGINKKTVTAIEPDESEVGDTWFNAMWEELDEAEDYLLTVMSMQKSGHKHLVHGFDNGADLPEGWTSSSNATFTSDRYAGQSAPSLRLTRNNDYLQTAPLDERLYSFSFWSRGVNVDPKASLVVSALDADGKELLRKEVMLSNAEDGTVTELSFEDESLATVSSVKISFTRVNDNGSAAIDDIDMAYGEVYDYVPMENYSEMSTGKVGSYRIEGLEPGNKYAFYVTATDGERRSGTSQTVEVETKALSGVAAPVVSSEGLTQFYSVDGRKVAEGYFGNQVPALRPGIYLRRSGGKTVKILVR